jgi:hypothetical protein
MTIALGLETADIVKEYRRNGKYYITLFCSHTPGLTLAIPLCLTLLIPLGMLIPLRQLVPLITLLIPLGHLIPLCLTLAIPLCLTLLITLCLACRSLSV